jgi:hypothetical protein
MIDKMGRGWCYTFIALVLMLSSSMLWVVMKRGPQWRAEKKRVSAEKRKAMMDEKVDAQRQVEG